MLLWCLILRPGRRGFGPEYNERCVSPELLCLCACVLLGSVRVESLESFVSNHKNILIHTATF